jgi:hypothetical protein
LIKLVKSDIAVIFSTVVERTPSLEDTLVKSLDRFIKLVTCNEILVKSVTVWDRVVVAVESLAETFVILAFT